jgi:hypothetical protein
MLETLLTGWRLAREYSGAVEAAQAVLERGGTVFEAIDAFAAQTAGAADDDWAAEVKMLAAQALRYAHQGVTMLHDATVKADEAGVFLTKLALRLERMGAK